MHGKVDTGYLFAWDDFNAEITKTAQDFQPLVEAIKTNNTEIVSLVLNAGAYVNLENDLPLRIASRQKNKEIVDLLLSYGANLKANYYECLCIASEEDFFYLAERILETENVPQAVKNKSLLTAVSKNYSRLVEFLLQKGADLHYEDDMVMFIASYQGHFEILKILLDRGANVNAFNGTICSFCNREWWCRKWKCYSYIPEVFAMVSKYSFEISKYVNQYLNRVSHDTRIPGFLYKFYLDHGGDFSIVEDDLWKKVASEKDSEGEKYLHILLKFGNLTEVRRPLVEKIKFSTILLLGAEKISEIEKMYPELDTKHSREKRSFLLKSRRNFIPILSHLLRILYYRPASPAFYLAINPF